MDTQNTEVQELYHINRMHLADLLFTEEELKFLKSILAEYFLCIDNNVNPDRIQFINNELTQLGMVKSNVIKDVLLHQQILEAKINGTSEKSVDFLNLESTRTQDEIRDIHKCFKNIKKEIFTIFKNRPSRHKEGKNIVI